MFKSTVIKLIDAFNVLDFIFKPYAICSAVPFKILGTVKEIKC